MQISKKAARPNRTGMAQVRINTDAAGAWVVIGDKESGVVYFGPFSDADPRVLDLRDKVLCR